MIKEEKGEKKITYMIEHYYCDLCGKEFIKKAYNNKWHTSGGNTITIVDDEESYDYDYGDDGGADKSISYDICTDCMINTIFKFIKQLYNKEPRDSSHEW